MRIADHGGNVLSVARHLGVDPSEILDLSASMNPFVGGTTSIVAKAAVSGSVGRYPDETEARKALCDKLRVDENRLVLTNGGAEAIALVANLLGGGWVEDPEFSLYRRHLAKIAPDLPRFRSNPCNPTGLLAASVEDCEVWDEAFYRLASGNWTRGDFNQGSFVVGSLTKLFACPGLRIGYVVAPGEAEAAAIESVRPKWSVNTLACDSIPKLLDQADLDTWHRQIAAARSDLVDMLAFQGFKTRPSDANWVLVDDAQSLAKKLFAHKVMGRDCTSFGMPSTVPIAVPGPAGLQLVESALAGGMS